MPRRQLTAYEIGLIARKRGLYPGLSHFMQAFYSTIPRQGWVKCARPGYLRPGTKLKDQYYAHPDHDQKIREWAVEHCIDPFIDDVA